ncbi:MAG TPA: hypothetical protein VKU00_06470 [Chthonomonadaceae bacterium]|nr:hypothetical protein [Chthonomonadaceae bacterium]
MTDASQWKQQCREYGESRLAVSREAKSQEDWQRLWRDPAHPYVFQWGTCWKQCIEYRVEDFAAEIGFFLDVVGLDSNALGPDFAMLTNKEGDFYFAVKPTGDVPPTPPDAIRLQFMLTDVLNTAAELERRGVVFEQPVAPDAPESPLVTGYFRTPHGIAVDLWGLVKPEPSV